MIIGKRLRRLREEKGLSQADVEKATGLLSSYISRVEQGRTMPSLEALEKLAAALEMPLFQLFYEGDDPPPLTNLSRREAEPIRQIRNVKKNKMSDDARLVFGTLAKAFSKL